MVRTNEGQHTSGERSRDMKTGRAFALKRTGGLTGLAGTLTVAAALMASQAVAAGGNPSFEGLLSAPSPSGFVSSPASYDISGGPVTVDFDVVATNLTNAPHTIALNFSAHHILTYNGTDVSDGQPGQPGITFNGPTGTTQVLIAGTQHFSNTWSPKGTQTLSLTYTFDACGYYQLDVWAPFAGATRDRATLASGFIRVLGCDAGPTPTPSPTGGVGGATPTPSPTGGVGGATPTPTGGVQAITTSTPSTGAGSGLLTLGALLLFAGIGMIVIGKRGHRADI
jgi:hypothetical protein